MVTRAQAETAMKTYLMDKPLRLLAGSLAGLDAQASLSDPERFARAVLIDVICERSPEADAAFEAWARSDDTNLKNGSAAIVAAVRSGK